MVMKSHEKSWNLKMHFQGLEKSWIFIFLSKYFVLFENWKHSCHPQKGWGFSVFSHGKQKLVMENSFVDQFLHEP